VKRPYTTDISGQMILLGTGTSVGVPALGCDCRVCVERRSRNVRTRCSAILGLPGGNLLIDTSPDMRSQLLRERIGMVHAVVFTHEHSDHLMGFDDLRLFQFYLGGPIPVFCNRAVEARIRNAFDYAFTDVEQTHVGAVPSIQVHLIDDQPFELLGARIQPIPLKHGPRFEVLGFRIGNVAYCTDTSEIPESSKSLMQGLDALVLDALRDYPHPTHMTIDQAVAVARELKVKQTWFTHSACSVDYYEVDPKLPEGIHMGYDGLRIPLT
jgi:phosphoribosyl 1,2-cyclic phosphate phosphodiesterase